jgi:hypothetical protein
MKVTVTNGYVQDVIQITAVVVAANKIFKDMEVKARVEFLTIGYDQILVNNGDARFTKKNGRWSLTSRDWGYTFNTEGTDEHHVSSALDAMVRGDGKNPS